MRQCEDSSDSSTVATQPGCFPAPWARTKRCAVSGRLGFRAQPRAERSQCSKLVPSASAVVAGGQQTGQMAREISFQYPFADQSPPSLLALLALESVGVPLATAVTQRAIIPDTKSPNRPGKASMAVGLDVANRKLPPWPVKFGFACTRLVPPGLEVLVRIWQHCSCHV